MTKSCECKKPRRKPRRTTNKKPPPPPPLNYNSENYARFDKPYVETNPRNVPITFLDDDSFGDTSLVIDNSPSRSARIRRRSAIKKYDLWKKLIENIMNKNQWSSKEDLITNKEFFADELSEKFKKRVMEETLAKNDKFYKQNKKNLRDSIEQNIDFFIKKLD